MTINPGLLDEESATEAIETVSEIAEENGVVWALVGGLAMEFYGGDCKTKNISFIADKLLPLENVGELLQGGERYLIKTNKKEVAVDWIIRNDEFKPLFKAALKEAVNINGFPVLTPEWLVILKYIAGRFKDQEDAVFLLSKKGLVDRRKIKKMIINIGSVETWAAFKSGLERWYHLADGKTANLKEGYIDS